MCGIVGYIGKGNAVPFLLQGLEKLEYRGYDSSGIAINSENKIKLIKKKGRLKVVEDIVKETPDFSSHIGIGHTRWATHGVPSDINAHPHMSSCGNFALVHNGIIENYIEIKENLIKKGYSFVSDTDSEVVVQLLSSLYNGDFLETVKETVKMLKGAFSLGIICKNDPNTLIAACKEIPLIVGVGENENYIASGIPAMLAKTRDICRLSSGQMAIIKAEGFEIIDFDGNPQKKEITTIDWQIDAAEKNGYDHFMLKEIMEQPDVINATISPRLDGYDLNLDNIEFSEEYLKNLNKISIVACGSAYHVGCAAKYFMEDVLRKSVEVDIASEFRYRNPIIDKNTLVIIISQSGETADSIAALREAKAKGARVLSVVNVMGSTIANESDDVIYTYAGPEIAVATTKAYSAQLVAFYLLTLKLSVLSGNLSEEEFKKIIDNLKEISSKISVILEKNEEILSIAKKCYEYEKIFFIGRNVDYAVCMEGSLKLKEISYIHSEAYAAGELKHGTISLVDENTLLIALSTQERLLDKLVSNIREVKSRGATVLSVTTEQNEETLKKVSDEVISIPNSIPMLLPSLAVVPLQILSYHVANLRGCDIDKPRNLAKSVTVE